MKKKVNYLYKFIDKNLNDKIKDYKNQSKYYYIMIS